MKLKLIILLFLIVVSSCSFYKEVPKKFDIKKYYDKDPFVKASTDQVECLRVNLGENILHQIRSRLHETSSEEKTKINGCITDFDTASLKVEDLFPKATKEQEICLKGVLGINYDFVRYKKISIPNETEKAVSDCLKV